jgi:hypothetical protein
MDNKIYEAAWDTIEPLMDAWFEIQGIHIEWYQREVTYPILAEFKTVYENERDALLISFGVTYDELCAENERRYDSRYAIGVTTA